MSEYKLTKYRGKYAIAVYADGKRIRRVSTGTDDPIRAKLVAPALFASLSKPKSTTVRALWEAYVADREGRAIIDTMKYTRTRIEARFFDLPAETITIADCRAHIAQRRQAGISDWTIYTELGHLRNVVNWAAKHKHIQAAPFIELPPQPRTQKERLTRDEIKKLFAAAKESLPHVYVYLVLLYATGARTGALLDLKWNRVNFISNRIDLRNPDLKRPHKGRAIVPINEDAREALELAKKGALTEYVVEWAGGPVKKLRKSLAAVLKKAGLRHINPHLIRHSAAAHLAEMGRPMEEIQAFLGHKDQKVTREIYAEYSPEYLREVTSGLEIKDDVG